MLNWHSNTVNSQLMAISAWVSGRAGLLRKWPLQNFRVIASKTHLAWALSGNL